jgi:hypothetical protein
MTNFKLIGAAALSLLVAAPAVAMPQRDHQRYGYSHCRPSNMREISATDRFTKPTALTGATTPLGEISPVTSTAETRSTDSQADERRRYSVTQKGGCEPPFCVCETYANESHRRK